MSEDLSGLLAQLTGRPTAEIAARLVEGEPPGALAWALLPDPRALAKILDVAELPGWPACACPCPLCLHPVAYRRGADGRPLCADCGMAEAARELFR